MNYSKRSFAIVTILFAVLLSGSSSQMPDAELASLILAKAQTAKGQCINVCRERYRACFSLKQIPSSECRGVYQDCVRFTCDALKG